MKEALWQGIYLGLVLSIFIGPSFFFLLNNCLEKGVKSANYFAIGIAISDFIILFLCFFSLKYFLKAAYILNHINSLSALVLLVYGVLVLFRKGRFFGQHPNPLFDGFLVNSSGPALVLFWFVAYGSCTSNFNFRTNQLSVLFLTLISVTLITNLLKVAVIHKYSTFILPSWVKSINLFIGIGLVLGAFVLSFHVFN